MLKRSTQLLSIVSLVAATSAYANVGLQMIECDNHIIDLSSTKAAVQKYCGAPDDIEQSLGSVEKTNQSTAGIQNTSIDGNIAPVINKQNLHLNVNGIQGTGSNQNMQSTVNSEVYPIETWTYIKGDTTEIITFANGKVRSIDTELG